MPINPTDNAVMDQLQRSLAASMQPINDYSHGLTALAISDRERGQKLQDIASERKFRQEESRSHLEEQMKAQQMAEDAHIRNEAAKDGVTTHDSKGNPLPINQIEKDWNAARTDQADAIYNEAHGRLQDAKASFKAAGDKIQNLFRSGADVGLKQEALKKTIDDPALSKFITPKQLAVVNRAINDPKISNSALDEVTKAVTDSIKKDYGILPGTLSWKASTAAGYADIFSQKYQDNLGTMLKGEQGVRYQELKQEQLGSQQEVKAIQWEMGKHVASNRFISPEVRASFNRSDAAKAVTAPTDVQSKAVDILKATAPTAPAPAATAPLGPPAPGKVINESGAPDEGGTSSGSFLDSLKRMFQNPGENSGLKPTPSRPAPVGGNIFGSTGQDSSMPTEPIPASQQEYEAVKKMAMDSGTSQQDIDQAEQVINDPKADPQQRGQAIYKWNKAITMLRANPSGNMPVPQGPNMDFPANAPSPAPAFA